MKKGKKADFGNIFKTNIASTYSSHEMVQIDCSRCMMWKYADRQEFELGDIEELARDILENGQVQPIIVRKDGENYEIISGQRRWRACALIKKHVMAVVVDASDADAFFIQNSENIKKDISIYSKSKSYFMVMNDQKISQKELCHKLGIAKSTLNEILIFNDIPQILWDAVGDMSRVSIRTAKYIKKLLEEDMNNLSKLLSIAKEIRFGVGSNYIMHKVGGGDKHDSVYFCNDVGERVIKVTDGMLMVMKNFRKEVDLIKIAEDTLFLKRERG